LDGSLLSSPVTTLGVIALVLVAVISGLLIPKHTVKLLLKAKDEEIAMWKRVAQNREEVTHTSLEYARESLGVNQTAVRALDALARVADQGDSNASTKVS